MRLVLVSKVDLWELATADTLVLTVSATDRDSGLNGEITYRLLSSPLQGFYIQPDSGKMVDTGHERSTVLQPRPPFLRRTRIHFSKTQLSGLILMFIPGMFPLK